MALLGHSGSPPAQQSAHSLLGHKERLSRESAQPWPLPFLFPLHFLSIYLCWGGIPFSIHLEICCLGIHLFPFGAC